MEPYLHFPNMSSWRGAQLSTGTTIPLPLPVSRTGKNLWFWNCNLKKSIFESLYTQQPPCSALMSGGCPQFVWPIAVLSFHCTMETLPLCWRFSGLTFYAIRFYEGVLSHPIRFPVRCSWLPSLALPWNLTIFWYNIVAVISLIFIVINVTN